ncbi:MAG TPA: hypothetical protein VEU47_02140 [Candidatus Cybelea sp.]|nr:hypothetical protein [Candidatus Cybelea sp.]
MAGRSAAEANVEAFGGEKIGPQGRYRFRADQRLAHLDTPDALAYRVLDAEHPEYPVYALASDPAEPLRLRVMHPLLSRSAPGLVNPLALDSLRIGGGERRNIVVLERPEGGTLAELGKTSAQEIVARFLPPLIDALDALAVREVTHRAIRLDNMFFMGANQQGPALGPCYSGAPGAGQAEVYEPLERATADPKGRGEGTISADLYALGVAMAGLIAGFNPAKLEDSYRQRVIHGSHAFLLSRVRMPPSLDAFLQGVLHDDPAHRWGMEQVRLWRNANHDRPRPSAGDRQAPRPFMFQGREYRHLRLLARDFAANPREAAAVIRDGGLEIWMRHSLGDSPAADNVHKALTRDTGSDPSNQDADTELVSRVAQVLDPTGPIRFRDLSVMRDGVGPLLASIVAGGDREKLRTIGALIGGPLLADQGPAQANEPLALSQQAAANLRVLVRESDLGAGMERCLYELNPTLPCLSPLIEGDGETLNSLPQALDRVTSGESATAAEPRNLLDRHVAGFLAARSKHFERRVIEIARAARDAPKKATTTVHLFAELQRYHCSEPLHGLAAWAASVLMPVVKTLHNADLRQQLLDALPRLAVRGDLAHLLSQLRLFERGQADEAEFRKAKALYQHYAHAIAAIDRGGRERAILAAEWGQWTATAIAFAMLILGLSTVFGRFFG